MGRGPDRPAHEPRSGAQRRWLTLPRELGLEPLGSLTGDRLAGQVRCSRLTGDIWAGILVLSMCGAASLWFLLGFRGDPSPPQGAGHHPHERTQLCFHLPTRGPGLQLTCEPWTVDGWGSSVFSPVPAGLGQPGPASPSVFLLYFPHLSAPPDAPVAEKLCTPLCTDSVLTLL